MLWMAQFSTAGELLWTNMPPLDASDWPRDGRYSFAQGAPLKVYVYEHDPDEKPAWWEIPSVGAVNATYEALPVELNERLKGLSDLSAATVDATYDYLNRKALPAGETAHYWLKIAHVQSAPCPSLDDQYLVCEESPGPFS